MPPVPPEFRLVGVTLTHAERLPLGSPYSPSAARPSLSLPQIARFGLSGYPTRALTQQTALLVRAYGRDRCVGVLSGHNDGNESVRVCSRRVYWLSHLTGYDSPWVVGLQNAHTAHRGTYAQWRAPICRRNVLRLKTVPFIINEETASYSHIRFSFESL